MANHDEIKLDYEKAYAMASVFEKGAEQLDTTKQEMQAILNTLESGALLGDGGAAFAEALRSKLCPAIDRLSKKFTEMNGDVLVAIAAMQRADAEAKKAVSS